jgi:hypothetical protein
MYHVARQTRRKLNWRSRATEMQGCIDALKSKTPTQLAKDTWGPWTEARPRKRATVN